MAVGGRRWEEGCSGSRPTSPRVSPTCSLKVRLEQVTSAARCHASMEPTVGVTAIAEGSFRARNANVGAALVLRDKKGYRTASFTQEPAKPSCRCLDFSSPSPSDSLRADRSLLNGEHFTPEPPEARQSWSVARRSERMVFVLQEHPRCGHVPVHVARGTSDSQPRECEAGLLAVEDGIRPIR